MFQSIHYEAIAEVLGRNTTEDTVNMVNMFCNMFEWDNANFNRDRFMLRVEQYTKSGGK